MPRHKIDNLKPESELGKELLDLYRIYSALGLRKEAILEILLRKTDKNIFSPLFLEEALRRRKRKASQEKAEE